MTFIACFISSPAFTWPKCTKAMTLRHQHSKLLILQMFLFRTMTIYNPDVDFDISNCVSDGYIEDFPADENDCCQEDEWLVRTGLNQYRFHNHLNVFMF